MTATTASPEESSIPQGCPEDRSHDPGFWEHVRQKYRVGTSGGDSDYDAESRIIQQALDAFAAQRSNRYALESCLGVGGTGVVFSVCDHQLNTSRALKIARPIAGRQDLLKQLLETEIGTLTEVSHPNVVGIYDKGSIEVADFSLHYYVMTFAKGVNAREFFRQRRDRKHLLGAIEGVIAAVKHLHDQQFVHLDLKPSNFYIEPDGRALLGDLGSARKLAGNPTDELVVSCTLAYAQPDLIALLPNVTPTDPNRKYGPVQRRRLALRFDLFALGKSLFELVRLFDEASPGQLDSYTRKYLALLAARLLDGQNQAEECALGLTVGSLHQLRLHDIGEVQDAFRKLIGTSRVEGEIPELAPYVSSEIRISTLARAAYTERFSELLKDPLVRRLAGVSQLGLLNLVYPTASHTRLEHSLGTYANCCRYIYALYYDPINPFFRQVMNGRDLRATLVAALLHDLGQYPLAHDLEEANDTVFSHSWLTKVLLKGEHVEVRSLTDALHKKLESWDIDKDRVLSIMDPGPDASLKDRLLHTLISGPLDADKLDYLVRDSRQCQVPYGRVIDFQRLLATLTVVYQPDSGTADDQSMALGIHEKGRVAAECVAFARYCMFTQVYWHHAYRAAKSMLHRVVWEWLKLDKRDNDRRKTDLLNFVLRRRSGRDAQPSLFHEAPASAQPVPPGNAPYPEWTQVHPGDMAMLQWLYARTSPTGRRLLDDLADRNLYKRLVVISRHRNEGLWDRLQDRRKNPIEVIELSERLRQRLLEHASATVDRAETEQHAITITGGDIDDVTTALKTLEADAAVLVDIPTRRPAEAERLLYYPEEMHRHHKEEFVKPSRLEDSRVWALLAGDLYGLAGKVRVFAHPKVIPLARALVAGQKEPILSHTVVERILTHLVGT